MRYWLKNKTSYENLKIIILSFWFVAIYGKITIKVEDSIDWRECERSYWARGRLVGYWAYGYYDPELPYQGNDLMKFCYNGSWGYVK